MAPGSRRVDRVIKEHNMRLGSAIRLALSGILVSGCVTSDSTSPMQSPRDGLATAVRWGPESPNFNLEVVLRGDGFGLVKFRQPNDENQIAYLDVWVRGLSPNSEYRLQRAVDTTLDGVCTSSGWLTLGKGLTPQTIATDDRGTGEEELFRDLGAFAPGATFDIHFRVIDAATSAVVLTSGCYEFTVSQ
jgi:hypothetical protein